MTERGDGDVQAGTIANRIHQKDQQYWDEWNRYYQVCLEYAECKGLPPSTCPPPPSSPSGPMPRQAP